MKLHIQHASTPELMDASYRVRYNVFADEEKYDLGSPHINGRRFVDYWDALDTTVAMVVGVAGKVIGTFRCVVETTLGLPQLEYFAAHRDGTAPLGRACFAGRMAVERPYRTLNLGILLQEFAFSYLRFTGIRFVYGVANLRYKDWWESLGYIWIGEPIKIPGCPFDLYAHYLDLDSPRSSRFSSLDHCQRPHVLTGEPSWLLANEGDVILQQGDAGEAIWELVEGETSIVRDGSGQLVRLGAGSVLGEAALLSRAPYAASAHVTSAKLLAIQMSRERFLDRLNSDASMCERLAQCHRKAGEIDPLI